LAAVAMVAAAAPAVARTKPAPAPSPVRAGYCVDNVPKTVHAGSVFAITCTYAEPIVARAVVLTPGYSDSYAAPTYVLQPAVDYTYQLDLDSGTNHDFVVLVRILRDIVAPFPTPDVDYYGLLFSYLATGAQP
ncbi:MAG TPA: hypothetical protein VJT31_13140, partial [Rugosimonospora sp.]|nr:hypothetical protein [Rugosimonospora sp.]